MDTVTKQLLNLLAEAMGTKENIEEQQEIDWRQIFILAKSHNILPVIYESAYKVPSFGQLQPELAKVWKELSYHCSMNQLYRTMEFLQIYDKLYQEGIQVLVVKGMICRALYPNHYYRSSGDEDVYINRSDFWKVDSIFLASGLEREKVKVGEVLPLPVTNYHSSKHGLMIELHIELFRSDTELFGPMHQIFEKAFEDSITMKVDGLAVRTLSHDKHLLFLILHSIKHFLSVGFGIRQVCDIVMYCNRYGEEIQWDWIWEKVDELGYQVFLLNLFDIGERYLGLETHKVGYPKYWSSADIHSEALLEDIMMAGIFGKSNPNQTKSASITLQAVQKDRIGGGSNKDKKLMLQTLFPELDYMKGNYSYSRRFPFLLPVAWLHRLLRYTAEEKSLGKMTKKAENSMMIGRKRIELMKEYRIIGPES